MTGDQELVQIVDAAVAEAMHRAGERIVCKRGCTHCCIGPFAVTERDLERLRGGFRLATADVRERLERRSMEARQTMRAEFPGDWDSGRIDGLSEADAFDLRHPWLPCPVLDLETGECSLHNWRPVACRLHGTALRVDGLTLMHCRLNYAGMEPAEVERLRVEFTTPVTEASELRYVAWAITGLPPSTGNPGSR